MTCTLRKMAQSCLPRRVHRSTILSAPPEIDRAQRPLIDSERSQRHSSVPTDTLGPPLANVLLEFSHVLLGYYSGLSDRRAARKILEICVTDVLKIFDSDLAGEKAIRGQIPQERKELDALAESEVDFCVFPVRNQIENLLLLFRRAVQIRVAIAIDTSRIEPHQPAAQLQLIVLIFAGEQVNELGRTGFNGAAGVIVRGNDCLAKRLQRLVVVRREKCRGIAARCGCFLG